MIANGDRAMVRFGKTFDKNGAQLNEVVVEIVLHLFSALNADVDLILASAEHIARTGVYTSQTNSFTVMIFA